MKRAVYAGSFDPFTKGHLYIYEQGRELFDEVVVLITNNPMKKRFIAARSMQPMISQSIRNENIVQIWEGLVADFCKNESVKYLVRGLRNTSDYMYEEEAAKINSEIFPELKTIYFRAKDDFISSTMVRLLHVQGKEESKYVPNEIKI